MLPLLSWQPELRYHYRTDQRFLSQPKTDLVERVMRIFALKGFVAWIHLKKALYALKADTFCQGYPAAY